jgi:ubiquinone/menaquinone biosynthesis C-methylase UbiE
MMRGASEEEELVPSAEPERYYEGLAAAYVRGRLPASAGRPDGEQVALGLAAGLRLHKFKRQAELPRVRRVLGLLRGLAPARLLDVGSGRGTFLWPLLDAFPALPVVAVDRSARRVEDLAAVHAGGVARLSAARMDAGALAFETGSFDGVALLEVLEHLELPAAAAAEALRVAERFAVASVPSTADDNPEHLRLYDEGSLTSLFLEAGAARVRCERVRGHIVALVAGR